MIIPPTAIRVARIKGTNKIHLTKLIPPDYLMDWKPLIVIGITPYRLIIDSFTIFHYSFFSSEY